jgi:hypothetical protein
MILNNIRKIFVLGDIHLGIKNNSIEWSIIQKDYLLNHFLKQVDEAGFDEDHDILIQLGDWHHVREFTNTRIAEESLIICDTFCKKFKRGVYCILGNHDVYYKDRTDVHSLKPFSKIFNNFYVFEKSEIINVNKTYDFLMFPWLEDTKKFKEELNKYKKIDLLFCHADIKGAMLNRVSKLEHGLEEKDLSWIKRVYSGHIHISQIQNNINYVGTPYEMDRGDFGNKKGFWILDIEKELSESFIENNFSPRHLKLDMAKVLNLNADQLEKILKNNFIDILIDDSLANKINISNFIEIISKLGYRRIEFFPYSTGSDSVSVNTGDSSYEYDIFTTLKNNLKNKELLPHQIEKLEKKFTELFFNIKNKSLFE